MPLKATEITPYEQIRFLVTLARAQYLTGRAAAAVQTQRRTIELAPEGDSSREAYEGRLAGYESVFNEQATKKRSPG